MLDLDDAIEAIKTDHRLASLVADLRRGLDDVVNDVVDGLINPARWADRAERDGT